MKAIKVTMPREMESAELHIFSDLHIGDAHCDIDLVKKRIEQVRNNPNALCILNGDICNNATKNSKSDPYTATMSPREQINYACDLFNGMESKILSIQQGNHENRTSITDGIDLSEIVASELGIRDRYGAEGACVFLKLGERVLKSCRKRVPVVYCIYARHGSGGGKREGGKVNSLADMMSIVDADIYVMGHTHLPFVMKQSFFRTDMSNGTVNQVEKMFVNSSASLNFGGYGEMFGYKPASKTCPVIYLSGTEKKFSSIL